MKYLKCYFKDTSYHLSLNKQKCGRFLFVSQLLSHPFSTRLLSPRPEVLSDVMLIVPYFLHIDKCLVECYEGMWGVVTQKLDGGK